MTRDLLKNPLWKAEDLGAPLPDSPHAASVCLPTWADIVGYEEGDESIISKLKTPYPRFALHEKTAELFKYAEDKFAKENEQAFIFPSEKIALECKKYTNSKAVRIKPLGRFDLHAVIFNKELFISIKEYWQHSGNIVSSRCAEAFLENVEPTNATEAKSKTKERIAALTTKKSDDVYLHPSGMSAFYNAFCAVQKFRKGKTIQLGFPYLDLLKIQEKFGEGVHLVKYDDVDDLQKVEKICASEPISAIFCEIPSNPLLKTIDLDELKKIATQYNIPIVIDDTVATWANVNLTNYADIQISSLTKFFSGVGDVVAGSSLIESKSIYYDELKSIYNKDYEDVFFAVDAVILEKNSRDFEVRIGQINKTTSLVCNFLKNHPKIEYIYYPEFIDQDSFNKVKTDGGGFSGLFSIILKDKEKTPEFYDKLAISKGPSLGTNFSLCSPYVLLAHYDELDFAEKLGADRYIIRVSIGLECEKDLIRIFENALNSI